jgi:ornithine cyclodeaminase/alanine dehydrogenase-like protein (mu-crystallin family)
MRIITEEEVTRIVTMPMSIEAVESAMREAGAGKAVNRPRDRARTPTATLHLMGAALPSKNIIGLKGYVTVKGAARFHVLLYSMETGELLALIEADRLGQQRTGAASGVATRLLARENADTMTLFGAGWQAESQLEAVAAVRSLKRAYVCSRTIEKRGEFCRKMSQQLDIPVVGEDDPARAVRQSQIVTTATSAREPVLKGEWLQPGTHVNAVGSNALSRREVDLETLQRASVIVVDSREQAERESGDLLQGVERGLLQWSQLPELGESLDRGEGRKDPDAVTLFVSHGLALWDLALASEIVKRIQQV